MALRFCHYHVYGFRTIFEESTTLFKNHQNQRVSIYNISMPSEKKNKASSAYKQCDKFGCMMLSEDFESHLQTCSSGVGDYGYPIILPGKVIIGLYHTIQSWEKYLPPTLSEWAKEHWALLSPDAFRILQIVPRSPCCLDDEHGSKVVLVYPCAQLSMLKICTSSKSQRKHLKLCVIPYDSIKLTKYLSLQLMDFQEFCYKDHFTEFIQHSLSGTYLDPRSTIDVNYFGSVCSFRILDAIEDGIEAIDIHGVPSRKICEIDPRCSINIIPMSKRQRNLSFADFGGYEEAKCVLTKYLIEPAKRRDPGCSLLLTGMTGTGKSLLLQILCYEVCNAPILCETSHKLNDRLAFLCNIERRAIFIDNFHHQKGDAHREIVDQLCRLLDAGKNSIILSCRSADHIEIALRRRFHREIELNVPSLQERILIISVLLKNEDKIVIESMAERTHGFTAGDLKIVCELAEYDLPQSGELAISEKISCYARVIHNVRPSGIKDFVLEVPNVSWDDICGNELLKREIEQAVSCTSLRDVLERLCIEPPSGILLYGPPGCCKTLIARAVACQSHHNFFGVKGPELFSKWVGESEKAVRELFRRARQFAPSIIFFDEIDAVAVRRNIDGNNCGVGDRVLIQLLTELDGLEKKGSVFFLAATNRPDVLDSALLRPGRIDRTIHVPLPDKTVRLLILRKHLVKASLDELSLDTFATRTEGYSGADLVQICRNAGLIAAREDVNVTFICKKHIEDSISMTPPTTDQKLIAIYEQFQRRCGLENV